MYNKNLFFPLAVAVILSGCQTTIEANQYTVLDPDINLDKSKPIVVDTFKENDLNTKFYVNSVIRALHKKGFSHVYTQREITEKGVIPLFAAYINVQEKFDSYTYESTDYGMVDSGNSTTNCTGFGLTATCNTTQQQTFGVTGTSTKLKTIRYNNFAVHYYDLATNQKVLFAMGTTLDKKCSKDFLYEFLIDETISRTSFDKPQDFDYKVKLPEGTKCNK